MVDEIQCWHANEGQISLVNDRYKHGTSSLKWEWSSSGSLSFTNPNYFRSIKWGTNKCFAVWLFNENLNSGGQDENQQPIYLEFLTENDSEPLASVWFHVNFHGWRPLGFRYALVPQMKDHFTRIYGVRFYPPSNRTNGVFYFNAITFDYTHAIGPCPDYQQPWATVKCIDRLKDNPMDWVFNPKNIFYNRRWLQEQQAQATNDDLQKLRDKWLNSIPCQTWSPRTKAEPFDKLFDAAKLYGVELNGFSNLPLGRGGFYSPSNALDIQPFLLGPLKRTATTLQCHRHQKTIETEEGQRVQNLFIQLCSYLLEQGWNEGNGNIEGHLDIGYEIRNFPMSLVYIRDSLNQVNHLHEIWFAAMWIMYGNLLVEEQVSTMNTDVIHNYLINLTRLICCLPDAEEGQRRLTAFRYMFNSALEQRIHEPLALDGTIHHHWMCHFAYSSYSLPDILNIATDLHDTNIHLSEYIHRLLHRSVFVLNFCLVQKDKIPPNLNARAGNCLSCNGVNMAKKCVLICNHDESYNRFMAGVLLNLCPENDSAICSYLNDGVDRIPLEGHLTLNSTAASIHRRSNFFVSIVGMGKNRRGLEIYGWLADTNNYGFYSRNCSIFVVPADANGLVHYANAGFTTDGWNWSHWPGTTSLLKPRAELFEGYCNLTAKNWLAGGTSLFDNDGMFSNDFFVRDVAFRRSVYCFDNRITVLTTNIKLLQAIARPVITTLFQSNFSGLLEAEQSPFIINDNEKISDFPFERVYENPSELTSITDHRNLTYYLHNKENENQSMNIILQRSEQTMIYCNSAHLIDPKQNPIVDVKSKRFKEVAFDDNEKYFKETKNTYGLGYVEHKNVSDGTASFLYTILIGSTSTSEWIEQFSRENVDPWSNDINLLPPSIILSKTDDTHIFFDRDTDTTCYTCYSDVRLHVDIGLVRSFGQPCMSMVRGRGPNPIRVSISTTDFNLNRTMFIVFKGKWSNPELMSDDFNGCVHVRSEHLDDGDTKVTVWQRLYMPVEFVLNPDNN